MNKRTIIVVEAEAKTNLEDLTLTLGNGDTVEVEEVIKYPFEGEVSPYLLYLLEKVSATANEDNSAIPSLEDLVKATLAVAAEREEVPVSLQRTINTQLKKLRDSVSQ